MVAVIDVLEDLFADDPLVYVAGNNSIDFDEGDPYACVSPDAYVVRGVEKRARGTYKVWEEGGHVPSVVFEVTSKSTRREDRGDKRGIYESELRVAEYFLFDPDGDWIPEQIRGFRLGRDGRYADIPLRDGALESRELGLSLVARGRLLRFLDGKTGRLLPTRAEARAQAERRAEDEKRRAEDEKLRADAAERRFAEERARADALAAELERLRGGKGPGGAERH